MPTLNAADCAALMDALTKVATDASQTILDLAATAKARIKADGSPVTAADEAAEAVICAALERLAPAVPIISEERGSREKPKTVERGSHFLVDPLDGTREFVAGRDEYTVNIALLTDGVPLLGVIAAPARAVLWRGVVGQSAERIADLFSGSGAVSSINTRAFPQAAPVIMVSRSHLDAHTQAYVARFPQAKLVPSGSSIKFCWLAEGSADLYPRLAPTHDWDVAAGHAVLKAAGGEISTPNASPLRYGTAELVIPAFVASGGAITA